MNSAFGARAARTNILAERTLLLDSHSFVWALTEPHQLPERSRSAVNDLARTVLVSAASIWEIAIKARRGHWQEAKAMLDDLHALLRRAGMTPLAVTIDHARAAGLLNWRHADPFDRLLAVQAAAEGAILITADRVFATAPRSLSLATLWA
jgi:PIN domain nuclease of toxin-antitoxin system